MENIMDTCAQTGRPRDFEAEAKRYAKRTAAIVSAANSLRESEIARTMLSYELESDEFYTAREKAIRLLS